MKIYLQNNNTDSRTGRLIQNETKVQEHTLYPSPSTTVPTTFGEVISVNSVPSSNKTSSIMMTPTAPPNYQSTTSTNSPWDELLVHVREAGLGMSQKDLVVEWVSDHPSSSISCDMMLQLLEMINIDMYKKDIIISCYPLMMNKESTILQVMERGISSLYHDEIRREIK